MPTDLMMGTALDSGSVPRATKVAPGGDLIPFATLAPELRPYAEAAGKRPPGYRQLYAAFLDGKFEAEKIGVSRHIRRADLPLIAEVMGLTASATPEAPRATRRSATIAASAAVPA